MSDNQEKKGVVDEDLPEITEAEKKTPPEGQSTFRMLQLQEQDLENQVNIGRERLKAMKWLRRTRMVVAVLAAVVPVTMLVFLGAGLACPRIGGFFYSAQVGMWPKIVVISGTFLTFIFVFGALVKGVFSASQNEDDKPRRGESHRQDLEDMVGKIIRNSGE